MKYTVYVKEVNTYAVEIEADSPQEAEHRCWDELHNAAVSTVTDGDVSAEYIVDENDCTYYPVRVGWKVEPERKL